MDAVLPWLLAAALAVALVTLLVTALLLRRARLRAADTAALTASARTEIKEVVAEETEAHLVAIRHALARERADTLSALTEEERRLTEERRAILVEQERRLLDLLAEAFTKVEMGVDERLRAFSGDLERAQAHLEAQLQRLAHRQEQAIRAVEARIETEAAELGSTADEQRKAVVRLREELEQAANVAVGEALDELESQTLERRRAIEEITERLRARETALADGVERAESDARGRLDVAFVEFERRQLDRLEKVVAREIDRHEQAAVLAFDERLREIREDAASRLARELDRAVDLLAREELARRLDEA